VMGRLTDLAARLDAAEGQIASVVIAVRELPPDALAGILATCDARSIPVRQMRFTLEDTDWRDRTPGVVRFPGR